jgi:protein arginine kinase activator
MKCPLNGLECTEPQIYSVNETVDGESNPINLCKQCIHAYLLNQATQEELQALNAEKESINNVFHSLMNLGVEVIEKSFDCCPFCGSTIQAINKMGRLGCTKCYDHFGSNIISAIQTYHGATKHVGKVPKKWQEQQEAEVRIQARKKFTIEAYIKQIEDIAKSAIKKEQYEIAAVCRDRLKEALKLQEKHFKLNKKISETTDEQTISEMKDQIEQIVDECFTDWSQSIF